jgi:hypothetical protein
MSSVREMWGSPAWMFQSKADAFYDLSGGSTLSSGNLDLAGTLDVTGAATFDSTVTITGTLTQTGVATFAVEPIVAVDDANNNTTVDLLTLRHTTSGTPAASLGGALVFDLENSTPAVHEAGRIEVDWETVTAASEDSDMRFQVYNGGTKVTPLSLIGAENAAVFAGRIASGGVAGSAVDIDSGWARGELMELRANVSDYTNIPQMDFDSLGDADIFTVAYLRSEAGVDGTDNGAVGVIGWGVANAVGCERIEGGRFWAYPKGDTAENIDYAWGVRGEFSMDAGRANAVTLVEAAAVAGRITSGKVADYTKIHGYVCRFGDMDGGSRTYGSGIRLLDGPESGTSVLTNVIESDLAATNLVKVSATGQAGITIDATLNTEQAAADIDGYITIDVGGTPYYIDLYVSKPTTA